MHVGYSTRYQHPQKLYIKSAKTVVFKHLSSLQTIDNRKFRLSKRSHSVAVGSDHSFSRNPVGVSALQQLIRVSLEKPKEFASWIIADLLRQLPRFQASFDDGFEATEISRKLVKHGGLELAQI